MRGGYNLYLWRFSLLNLNIFREVLRGGTLYSKKKGWHRDERTWRRQPWWEKEDMQNHRGKEALDFLEKKNVYRGQNLD